MVRSKRILASLVGYYKVLAVISLNCLILFLMVNLIAAGLLDMKTYFAKEAAMNGTPFAYKRFHEALTSVHPGLTDEQITRLITETRKLSQTYEPYTQFKERPYSGKYVNVDPRGFRPIGNQNPWPPPPGKFTVFVFGGSTTFGYGVPDNLTIPARLQEQLVSDYGVSANVYNFGRGSYFCVQERLLFEKLLASGFVPDMAVGVQSFQDELLKQMERYHKYGSGSQIQERLAKYSGTFDTLNVDMIFNFPTQTGSMLDNDLKVIKDITADQVTFYPLMVSDITRAELARRFGPISYRQEKLFYNRIAELLEDDYTCGTAWCFSRKKSMIDEYIVDYDEYVGAGSGSFGYVNGACFANTFSVRGYLTAVREGQLPILAKKDFSKRERALYDFMMKLFGTSLDIRKEENKFGGEFMKTLWKEISLFRVAGALVNDDGIIRLTRRGRYLWVIMMREFFTGVNNFRDICRTAIQASNECMQ